METRPLTVMIPNSPVCHLPPDSLENRLENRIRTLERETADLEAGAAELLNQAARSRAELRALELVRGKS